MRERAVPMNHNLPCIFIELSPLNHFYSCCLSRPYLENYKRDCNGTWFIDRWQYEKGQCTVTVILPGIFTELSPLKHLFFTMDASLKVQKGLKWNLV